MEDPGHSVRGQLWGTVLIGHPGFLTASAGGARLSIKGARQFDGDRLKLRAGQKVGCLVLRFAERYRVRVNGTVEAVRYTAPGQLDMQIAVEQAYDSCKKYVNVRHIELDEPRLDRMGSSAPPVWRASVGAGALGAAEQSLVQAADTFFIASSSCPLAGELTGMVGQRPAAVQPAAASLPAATNSTQQQLQHQQRQQQQRQEQGALAFGCDISLRGGMPGFVQVLERGAVLKWGDYPGNYMFNTGGNLLLQPTAALLFLDFKTGDTLQVSGSADVLHGDMSLPGSKRAFVFRVHDYVHVTEALPITTRDQVDYSPFNPGALGAA
ncbi:hypothetical protein N2152v2_009884 [Parachlorella kessleri]